MTQGTNTDSGIKSYQVVNKERFQQKWQSVLETHLVDSQENSFLERNRLKGLNILYVDHYVPEPDKDSGSLRTFNMLGILAQMKNKITLWPDNLNYTNPYVTELQQKGIEVMYGKNDFDKFLNERKQVYDVAILTRPYISIKYIDAIKEKMPDCKIIYDTVDLHFLRMERQATLENKGHAAQAKAMRQLEFSLMEKSDLTILTSEAETEFIHKENDSIKLAILPNIHVESEKIHGFEGRENMFFVGGFQHPPNIDAANYLMQEIWPLIKLQVNGAKLFIIGSNPTDEIKKLASEDVVVTGFVKDIAQYHNGCKVMLAPLRYGAGVKGKITESLAMGIPVITTPVGAEGINLKDGNNCMIASKPEEFAKKVLEVYSDEKLWKKLSQNGIEVAKEYSPENARACLEAIILSLFSL